MSKSDDDSRGNLMKRTSWKLSSIGQLSILLEASSPKPGNVNRHFGFSDTDYRHFLASASLMARGLYMSASRGVALAEGKLSSSEINIGELIHLSAQDTFTGINKRNTILGTILLYIPLVVASAAVVTQEKRFSTEGLVKWLKEITKNTSVDDTLNLYKTFHLIRSTNPSVEGSANWTETHSRYDIDNPQILDNILEDKLTLYDLFKLSADVDEISSEWANKFQLTISQVFPYLDKITDNLENLEEGIVQTFVWLLSLRPDGLIAKKAGEKRAEEVRALAEKTMKAWNHDRGPIELMIHLDEELRKEGNLLNPGTTADLVSAGIFCKLVALDFH
ncbi:MAG: 2-(5''-triphosphoribosyl)-3'-dephosphocoenzyme-A synthase [Candidatus Thorarchaeota archaeon AB_25]|nr:MAG: 2-(5''-triphosphoribosyl)-3'-dephosphocoenzyme-A synthase [Candidatus Thorarchaeota archaeon AB_25]